MRPNTRPVQLHLPNRTIMEWKADVATDDSVIESSTRHTQDTHTQKHQLKKKINPRFFVLQRPTNCPGADNFVIILIAVSRVRGAELLSLWRVRRIARHWKIVLEKKNFLIEICELKCCRTAERERETFGCFTHSKGGARNESHGKLSVC